MKKLLLLAVVLLCAISGSARRICVWSGSYSFPGENGLISVAAEKFANLQLGDRLVANVSEINNPDGWGAQINIAGNTPWTTVPETNWSACSVGENKYAIDNEALLNSIKNSGISIQGKFYNLTALYIDTDTEEQLTSSVWSGSYEFADDGNGWAEVGAAPFADLQLGDALVVTVDKITNPEGWAQINIAGRDPWKEVPGTSWSGCNVGENRYVINDADVLASIKKGGIGIQGKYYVLTDVSIEKQQTAVTVTITDAGIATMMLPFSADIPDGMSVYTVGASADGTVKMLQTPAIAANVPYIIKGEPRDYEFSGVNKAELAQYSLGYLIGTYELISAPVGSYILQNGAQGVGFYRVAAGKQPTIAPNRAYISLPSAHSVARLVLLFDGDTTGVETLAQADKTAHKGVYNLAGMSVGADAKGLVIKNGRKYIVK